MKAESRGITGWLVSLTAICLVTTPGGRACPRRCACYMRTEVHCTFRYLTAIPDGIPPDVERINLGYNSLVRLTERDFSGLNKLELLMLHSNAIHTIPDQAFADLQALQVLKLSYNKVQNLRKETLYGLRNLTRLHLDHNHIEFINPEVFHGLTFLRLVHLEGNQLTKLHPDTFVSLRYLQIFKTSFIKYLYLSDNFLTSLPQEMVSYMPGLESLYLHGNPWTCDCNLKWLSDWIREKPDVIKCKRDRSAPGAQQCPLCVDPRASKGKPLAVVPAAAFQCVKPTIDSALKRKHLTVLEDTASAFPSPQDFMAPLGSLTLNMTDQSGNEANVVCRVQKPSRTSSTAFTEQGASIVLHTPLSTGLVCNVAFGHIQPVWQVLALYSDSPLILERARLIPEASQHGYKYKQVASKAEGIFTNIEAHLNADPSWLMQDYVSLRLDRAATTLSTLHICYSSDVHVTVPREQIKPGAYGWTLISRDTKRKPERTVLVGGAIELDCPARGDPTPHLEWLLSDGSEVRAPYVSEDGRLLIDESGKLELLRADRFDAGPYHCISTNAGDADVLTYRLTVVEPPVGARHEDGAPHTVVLGDTLELPCPSTGSPDASVSWVLPGSTVLSQSSRDKHIGEHGALRIMQVTQEDQGLYRCVAANPSGVDLLTFRVSVQTEEARPAEPDGEVGGSGLDGLNPGAHPTEPPAVQLLTSAPVEAEVGNQVPVPKQEHSSRESAPRRRGDFRNRQFGEHRRQFPPAARRIDPQRWAVLLGKAKQTAALDKPENSPGQPTPPGPQPQTPPGEGEGSGVLPPDEELLGPARTLTADPTATSPDPGMDVMTSGTSVSPAVSPLIPPPGNPLELSPQAAVQTTTTTVSMKRNPTASTKRQDTPSPNSHTVSPPRATSYVSSKVLSHANSTSGVFLASVNTPRARPTPAAAASEPRSKDFYSHAAQRLSASTLSADPHAAAKSGLEIPRNITMSAAPSRRFGRRRKIWGRGRLVSPYRTPALGRHRYGLMRPRFGAAPEERSVLCPSCSPTPTERLASATAAWSSPAPPPVSPPQTDFATPTSGEPARPLQSRPLLAGKEAGALEVKVPAVKDLRAEGTRAAPTDAARTRGPTSFSLGATHSVTTRDPNEPSSREVERDSLRIASLPEPITKPSTPRIIATTSFPRKKFPGHHVFVNNYSPKEWLKKQHQFHAEKSTVFPQTPPAHVSPFHIATLSTKRVSTSALAAQATAHGETTAVQIPSRPSPVTQRPFTPLDSVASVTSQEPHITHLKSTHTAMRTTPPTAFASVVGNIQTVRPKDRRQHRRPEPQKDRGGLNLADLTPPSVFASTPPPLESPKGIASKVSLHSRPLRPTDGAEAHHQQSFQPRKSTTAREAKLSRQLPRGPTTRETSHSTGRPILSSPATPMPVPTHPFPRHSATDHVAAPTFRMIDAVAELSEPSRGDADSHPPVAGTATSAEVPPSAKFTIRPTPSYSDNLQSAPMPVLLTVKPQSSKPTPAPWTENQFWPKSYPEIPRKKPKLEVSVPTTFGSPGALTPVPKWDGSKTAPKSGFERTQVTKTITSEFRPFDMLSRSTLEKPRIVGGNAASFTVPAESDAFLPCEAAGDPAPTVRWTRVSSGLDLSGRKQRSRFWVHPNGTLSIQSVGIQDRGQYLCSASNPLGTDRLHVTLSVVSYPPRILERRPKEITVHSGSSVALKCRAEGRPSPEISWVLANQTVLSDPSEGSQRARVQSDGTLVVDDVSIYDRGFYKCTASNLAGRDSLLVRMQVIAAPPVILEQKRQVLVGPQGDSLTFPCTAGGTPRPSVYWVLPDGTEVKPLQRINPKFSLHLNGTLSVRQVASEDGGTYECIATSSTGSERRVVTLVVEEREMAPRIEAASRRWMEVNFGDRLLLNCSAVGQPKPRMIWRLPSKAVVDQWHRMGSRIHVYSNGSLSIDSVTERDGGDYVCVARNTRGDDLVRMHVSLRPEPAKIDRKPHPTTRVQQGKDFQVDCKASGSPVPEITWSLPDGTLVTNALQADDSGRGAHGYTLFDNGTLYFNRVGAAQEGDYTCYAHNTVGKDQMKVHLTVVTAAPSIRQGSKIHRRVHAGDTATLDCAVTGEPRVQIFWRLPSNEMISFSTDRYTFHANSSLSIGQVGLRDAGDYVCVSHHPGGGDTARYRLDVVPEPPRINGGRTTRTVMEATAVRHSRQSFDCRAEGTPAPQITWLMPDNLVLQAPYHGSRVSVHRNGTLEIRNVRPSDAAEFVCVARNAGGESTWVVRLQVLEMLRRPTFRNPRNQVVVAQLGRATALDCWVEGNPPPRVTWMLPNGTSLSKGPRTPQGWIADNGSLIIPKTAREDAGRYRCAARNAVGYIEKLVVLEVGQQPVILTSARGVVQGVAGEPLWLHCVSAGSPPPSVQWALPSGQLVSRPSASGPYILHENGTLLIREAAAHHGGSYVCQARNSVGQARVTVPVTIMAYPPRITSRPPERVLAKAGAAVRLHCVALGVPKPEVTWEMPGYTLLSGQGRAHGSELLHPQGTLVLQHPRPSDSGTYRCRAKNPLGSDYATAHIRVI
ncbi:immunoglobulin superfamily member 10 [Echinops telfairi]|uniref:immunoglobulin superfamily member 10 n=1 Tax=Echinops telfairi TaxID=9371 RepID=UPI000333DC3A|nr:immunoglobulin superfamily member 10 [Echinops telfairi]